MPRKSKGVRKWLRKRDGRPSIWVILDGSREVSTGCLGDDVAGADRALERYLAERHKPEWRKGDPAEVSAADVMLYYVQEHAPRTAHPELIGFHMLPLNQFFGGLMCAAIDRKSCRDYVKAREAGTIGRRVVKAQTARRELETLQAALNFAHGEGKLIFPIKLDLPDKAPPRERWLERWEVAALVAGALGFVPIAYDVVSRRPAKWRRLHRPQYHVARFILIGVYSGTRHDAILKMRWERSAHGGWFDLERGIMFRRGDGEGDTKKRRPPVPITDNLMPHLARWRRNPKLKIGPIEYQGRLIAKMKTGFENARDRAGLGGDVVPHVMRHTCATWNLNRGVSTWDVAGMLGTTEKVIRDTYGHHSTDHLAAAKKRFRGQKTGETEKGKGRP